MKHQSLIEHLNLPPGYDVSIAEKAIDRYMVSARVWYKLEGFDEGYEFGYKEAKWKIALLAGVLTAINLINLIISLM